MFKNYITIAYRHLTRHKLFSAINILCLAIGITFAMLIGVYILREKGINSQLRNAGNQYVVKSKWKVKDMGLAITTIAPLPRTLKESYPSLVANYYRFNPVTNVVSAGDKHFKENISIGDTSLVSMYGFDLLHGDPSRAFKDNSSAVITEQMAMKLFGVTDVIGKTISVTNTVGGKQDFLVSAVLKDMTYNTVNNFIDQEGYNVFVPFEGNRYYPNNDQAESWGNVYNVGMIELKPGVIPSDMAKPVADLLAAHLPENLRGFVEPEFVPMKDYYLADNNGAVKKMITTLALVAGFILLMAIINFVNINIGTSSYRLKEIGLRKVFGSARRQLIVQHLSESLLLTAVAALLSLVFYELSRNLFEQLLNTQLDPIWQFDAGKIGMLLLLVLAVGSVAGIYPAFILSSSRIIHAVKGKIDTAMGGLLLRKTLLVVQFTLAIAIFICALTVSKQVSYFFNKDIGYNKEQLLVATAFPKQWDSIGVKKMETIRDGLMQVPAVRSASISFEVPDRTPPQVFDLYGEGADKPVVVPTIAVDENYAATFGLKVTKGNFFTDYNNSETGGVVLNETAVKAIGLKDPVGKIIHITAQKFPVRVLGVVKDFNYSTFQQSIGPVAFSHVIDSRSYRYLTLKLQAADITAAIGAVKEKWAKLSPDSPFEYTFMDERFALLYKSELQLKQAADVATALNLLIVFMGIFGIVAFTLARRTKEIAVRKVLGAGARNIVLLFVKDYALLILIANLVAWPLAYLVTNRWLENYVYRVQQDVLPYLSVTLIIFLVSAVFIAAQCFRAAVGNPVKNLRTE